MIKIEHLVKNYGTTCAVDDISFSVEEGEIVGLLAIQPGLSKNPERDPSEMETAWGILEQNDGSIRQC